MGLRTILAIRRSCSETGLDNLTYSEVLAESLSFVVCAVLYQ